MKIHSYESTTFAPKVNTEFGLQGMPAAKLLQTDLQKRNWTLGFVERSEANPTGRFVVLGCPPSTTKEEIEALFDKTAYKTYRMPSVSDAKFGEKYEITLGRDNP